MEASERASTNKKKNDLMPHLQAFATFGPHSINEGAVRSLEAADGARERERSKEMQSSLELDVINK